MCASTKDAIYPDGPRGIPFLGNLPEIRQNPLRFLEACGRDYGDVTRLRLAYYDGYLVNSPELIHRILVDEVNHFTRFAGHKSTRLSRILNGGAGMDRVAQFPMDGDFWLRERWLVQPALTPTKVVQYGDTMVRHAQKMMDRWKKGEVRDIYKDMVSIAYSVISETMFNAREDDDLETLHKAFEIIIDRIATQLGTLAPVPGVLPTNANRALRWSLNTIEQAFTRLVEKHHTGEYPDDLISRMIHTNDGKDRTQDREWRFQVFSLLAAGYETSAVVLTWIWYLLAQNPDVRQMVQVELQNVLNGRPPKAEDIPRLKKTRAVFDETLRLYPPAWCFSPLIVREDCVIAPYKFRKGTIILLSPWVTHRDPRHFEFADRFYPQRWDEENAVSVNKHAFFPFGRGPRHCVGSSFATTEVMLTVATIAQSFDLELASPGSIVLPKPHVSLRPGQPVMMQIRHRA